MKNETLNKIIEQIKKYNLSSSFSDVENFKKWVSELNDTQINNFLSFDMDLEKNDIYDVIFIVSRFSSLDSIVPIIKNNKSKNIVFVGNNMLAEKYMNIEGKNVLFAFFMAAGKKYDGYINSICLNKIEIGRVDGKDISNDFIKSIFKKTKIKVTIENKMNDYLKTHACAVLPLVFASYKVNGNLNY